MAYRTHIRLIKKELDELSSIRGRTKEATYCQDAALWLAELCVGFLHQCQPTSNNCALQLLDMLGSALSRYRPAQGLRSRKVAKRIGVEFKDDEEHLIDMARTAERDGTENKLDRTTFIYVAVQARLRYEANVKSSQPPLEQILQLA